jgi:hypothetical protein
VNFSITVEEPEFGMPGTGSVQVGWIIDAEKGAIIYDPPERVRSVEMNKTHAKSASRCPALLNLESRYFIVKCPVDLALDFIRDEKGKAALRNRQGEQSPVRKAKLNDMLSLVSEPEWRYPNRPTLQLKLPYIFIADEPVYMSQVAPFLHYAVQPLPGTIFAGRFPIHIWPRPLMWAFEWHDITKPLLLKRGDPLFYVMFETRPQERPVQLVEAQVTPQLREYLDLISGAVNYVNQTFSLFKAAEARRPTKLLQAIKRT